MIGDRISEKRAGNISGFNFEGLYRKVLNLDRKRKGWHGVEEIWSTVRDDMHWKASREDVARALEKMASDGQLKQIEDIEGLHYAIFYAF